MIQGTVDWYEQPAIDLIPVLKGKPGIEIRNVPLGLILLMRFNPQQPPFNNPRSPGRDDGHEAGRLHAGGGRQS